MGHSLEFLSIYFACEHSEIFPSIIYCALLVFLDSWMHQKTQNSRDETTAMETHFYTTEIFFSCMRIFLYTFRNIPYNFFFMLFSYFQNNECKKISKFEREDKSNGIPLVQHGFFSFHENFPIFIQKLSLQFFIISRIMNGQKSRNSRGKTRAMESHFFTIDFFLSRQFSYEHSEGRQCTTCVVWN